MSKHLFRIMFQRPRNLETHTGSPINVDLHRAVLTSGKLTVAFGYIADGHPGRARQMARMLRKAVQRYDRSDSSADAGVLATTGAGGGGVSVDIEKLRALCADVPERLTVDYRGDVVIGVDGIAAERTGVHPVGSLFPLMLRSPRGDGTALAVAELAARARPAILALCDEVERLEDSVSDTLAGAELGARLLREQNDTLRAEVERLRAENARLARELAVLNGTYRARSER